MLLLYSTVPSDISNYVKFEDNRLIFLLSFKFLLFFYFDSILFLSIDFLILDQ